jgi:hypothetical protein
MISLPLPNDLIGNNDEFMAFAMNSSNHPPGRERRLRPPLEDDRGLKIRRGVPSYKSALLKFEWVKSARVRGAKAVGNGQPGRSHCSGQEALPMSDFLGSKHSCGL